jgi:Zinc-ribbon containing domain
MTELGSSIAGHRVDPGDYVEFVRAGVSAVGQFACTACGHRIVTHRVLPPCIQCGETTWERSTGTPFTTFTERLRLIVDTEGRALDRVVS